MQRNFEFDRQSGGFSVIQFGDRVIDLHNAYDLERFGTAPDGSEVELCFVRNEYAIDPETLPAKAMLRCGGNVRLAFNDLRLLAAPSSEEGIEIAYFDMACDWSSFTTEDMANRQHPDGMHVSFTNGLVVRVYCETVTLTCDGEEKRWRLS